eukprot:1824434-Pyramimonas_sp.AAC.1
MPRPHGRARTLAGSTDAHCATLPHGRRLARLYSLDRDKSSIALRRESATNSAALPGKRAALRLRATPLAARPSHCRRGRPEEERVALRAPRSDLRRWIRGQRQLKMRAAGRAADPN